MDNNHIDGMIQRVAGWIADVRPAVEDHAFNGHKLDEQAIASIYGKLTEAASSYTAMLGILGPKDTHRKAMVLNNSGFARYLAGLVLMESDYSKARNILEAAEKDLTEANNISSLGAADTNLKRVKKALAGELS